MTLTVPISKKHVSCTSAPANPSPACILTAVINQPAQNNERPFLLRPFFLNVGFAKESHVEKSTTSKVRERFSSHCEIFLSLSLSLAFACSPLDASRSNETLMNARRKSGGELCNASGRIKRFPTEAALGRGAEVSHCPEYSSKPSFSSSSSSSRRRKNLAVCTLYVVHGNARRRSISRA